MSAHLQPLKHAVHSGCLNCPSKPVKARLRWNPHPGFGSVTVTRDGEHFYSSYNDESCRTFISFERWAAKDPDHDWRVRIDAPLYDVTYQRHGPKTWHAVEKGIGFA